jgi:CheY-like chemotaxis protein
MAVSTRPCVVLLTDDDVVLRNLLRHILEAAGFLVLAAADGLEALAHSRACPQRIDVLVTDVEMPAMDGIALAEQIRRERKDISVLLMSAGTMQQIPEHIPFIAKPFLPKELLAKLEEVLADGRDDEITS